jgi:hypothetical protein
MNAVKSTLSLLVFGGILLALVRNPGGTATLIKSGSDAFVRTYRVVSGTDPSQNTKG